MATNNTHNEMVRVFRQELLQRTKRIRQELIKELTDRFQADLIKIAATVTLDLDHFFSVEKLQDDVVVTLKVKT